MMKTLLYIGLVLLSLVTVFYSYTQRRSLESKFWSLKNIIVETRYELNDIKEQQRICLATNGFIVHDSLRSKIPIHTLVLRLHNDICLSCYAENIQLLGSALEKMEQGLFILGSYSFDGSLRDEISIIKDSTLRTINIPALHIIPADSINVPYVFFINENGQLTNVHFFAKKDFSLTQEYLKSIERFKMFDEK